MNIRILLTVSFALIAAACENSKEKITIKLTNRDVKCWNIVRMPGFYEKDSSKVYPLFCYCFDSKGKRILQRFEKGKMIKYETDDVVIPEVWKYLSDTSILLGNTVCKIEKLTNDTFVYSNQYYEVVLSSFSK